VSNRRRGAICGETNPCFLPTPGPTGHNDTADVNRRVTTPQGRGPIGTVKGGHKQAAAPVPSGCRASGYQLVQLSVQGHPSGSSATTVNVYIFVDHPNSIAKARRIALYLNRMPPIHVQQVFQDSAGGYVIFIINNKPRYGQGGGTWKPTEVDGAFRGRQGVTCVSDSDLQSLALTPGRGVIGLPMNRWGERHFGRRSRTSRSWLEYTVMHEVGHAVDYFYSPRGSGGTGLAPAGTRVSQLSGIRDACGGRGVGKYVAEAYARFLLNGPSRICNNVVQYRLMVRHIQTSLTVLDGNHKNGRSYPGRAETVIIWML
jgi:hypothetical protein